MWFLKKANNCKISGIISEISLKTLNDCQSKNYKGYWTSGSVSFSHSFKYFYNPTIWDAQITIKISPIVVGVGRVVFKRKDRGCNVGRC